MNLAFLAKTILIRNKYQPKHILIIYNSNLTMSIIFNGNPNDVVETAEVLKKE